MAKVNIKKLLFLTVGLVLIMGFGIWFMDPPLSASQPEISDLGINNTYFKLFKEVKELNTNNNLRPGKLTNMPVLKRNPFVRPDVYSGTKSVLQSLRPNSLSQNDLRLSGILWGNELPSAVINGEVVQVGNKLGQFRVKQILKKRVILRSQEGKIVLHLPQDEKVE